MDRAEIKDMIDDIADAQRTISRCVGALLGHIDKLEALIPKPPEPQGTQWLYRIGGEVGWMLSHSFYRSEESARRGIQVGSGLNAEFKRFTQKEGE